MRAESDQKNQDRVRFLLRGLARRHKYVLSQGFEEALVSLILNENAATRRRLAYLTDIFGEQVADPTQEKISNLAFVLLAHLVNDDGTAFMPADLDKHLGIE